MKPLTSLGKACTHIYIPTRVRRQQQQQQHLTYIRGTDIIITIITVIIKMTASDTLTGHETRRDSLEVR